MLPKIHQSFYLQYMKDVALVTSIDDITSSTIASMIFVNNVQVVTHLTSDSAWLASMYVSSLPPSPPVYFVSSYLIPAASTKSRRLPIQVNCETNLDFFPSSVS